MFLLTLDGDGPLNFLKIEQCTSILFCERNVMLCYKPSESVCFGVRRTKIFDICTSEIRLVKSLLILDKNLRREP